MSRFSARLLKEGLKLRHTRPEILQVNVGRLCNLTCMHCHVNAGPKRKEIMTRETIDRIIDWLAKTEIAMVDLTGGAPEMIPDFRFDAVLLGSKRGRAARRRRVRWQHRRVTITQLVRLWSGRRSSPASRLQSGRCFSSATTSRLGGGFQARARGKFRHRV